jgi:2-methylisocitrate lyase-like PEP mutase family enzyme
MADADTGYGNAITVFHVIEYFEEAGVVGVNIEDQAMPKRCGAMRGKELVEPLEMALKIEAAQKAKKDPDFIINARTDAIAVEGIDGTIARVKAYVAAGADMIYPDAIRDEDDIKRVIDAAGGVPVSINMGFGIRSRPTTPLIPIKRLAAMGVARISLPRMLPAAALHGMQQAILALQADAGLDHAVEHTDLQFDMEQITDLVGYARVATLENDLLSADELNRKYHSADAGHVDYVIRNP